MKTTLAHLVPCCALALLLSGCATGIGPRAIQSEYLSFNERAGHTSDQELLLNLVRLRYVETPMFLEMGDIVAQYSYGEQFNFSGEAVITGTMSQRILPGIGTSYGERPTVTYTPLKGEEFARRLFTPIPPETIVLLSQSGWPVDLLLMVCGQRINGIENAVSASGLAPADQPEYQRYEELAHRLRKMQRAGKLNLLLEHGGTNSTPYIRLFSDSLTNSELQSDNAFIRQELGMGPEANVFKLTPSGLNQAPDEVALNTRSLAAVLGFLAKGVQVPAADVRHGLAPTVRSAAGEPMLLHEPTDRYLRVRVSELPPGGALVRIHHRGHWYYLADDDITSKHTFLLLHILFSLQTASGHGKQPFLTIPTGP